ncbi:type IV toxin-antitoxin system AbiEi family antitoxin domain-containing protein [Serinicoccus profundi]|uniref:type IV toxin-antitoxin system AbiEi family antitoxin domain-containing protein n=1 Tax=Serinicoccus profundi TaxID=1078471 RepID=UPI000255E7B6|nr:type IV toxin-antitoxin system AbiEi family antitoxin domain-containing protein [Serinicoccus profundi]
MRDEVRTLLAACGQVMSIGDLQALGFGPDEVRAMVRSGELVRIRRGAFVSGVVWRAAAPWERPALRARAVLRGLGPEPAVAPSHQSSLAVQAVSVHGTDDRVHLCRLDDGRSRQDDVVCVHRRVPAAFLIDTDVGPCVHAALASLQVATRFGVEAGLVSADAALRLRMATRAELEQALHVLRACPRRAAAARVVELASPLSESAGESRTRWVLLAVGLPLPEQQAEIADEHGLFVARVDFLFRRERVIVEFDGMLKYDDPTALRREKLREDRLRELGYEVVRLTWADLADPRLVERRLRGAFARARARR